MKITFFFEKRESKEVPPVTLFRGFSRLCMALFSGFFGCLYGLFGACSKPHPEKEGPTPNREKGGQFEGMAKTHTKRTGQIPTREGRANLPPRELERRGPTHSEKGGPTFTPRAKSKKVQPLHSKKEWRTSPPTTSQGQFPPEKERPTATIRRMGPTHPQEKGSTTTPQEGTANPNPEKEGSTPLRRRKEQPPRRKGQLPHLKDRTNSFPKKDKSTSNHEKEKPNPTLQKKGEPTKRMKKEWGNSDEGLPTFHTRTHCFCHFLCDTRSEN